MCRIIAFSSSSYSKSVFSLYNGEQDVFAGKNRSIFLLGHNSIRISTRLVTNQIHRLFSSVVALLDTKRFSLHHSSTYYIIYMLIIPDFLRSK